MCKQLQCVCLAQAISFLLCHILNYIVNSDCICGVLDKQFIDNRCGVKKYDSSGSILSSFNLTIFKPAVVRYTSKVACCAQSNPHTCGENYSNF